MTDVRPRAGVVLLAVAMLMTAGVAGAANLSVSSGVSYETPNGFEVQTNTDISTGYSNPFNGTGSVYLNGVNFTATGNADLGVDSYEGTWTNVSSIATNTTTITVDPDDKDEIDIRGGLTKLQFSDAAIQGNDTQFVYSASSAGNVTIHGLTGSTEWVAATQSGTALDSGTTTAAGAATIELPAATDSKVMLYSPDAPTLSSPQPADGTEKTDLTQEFSVDVDDPDFTNLVDELNVSIYVDGSRVHSENITSAQTVNTTYSLTDGGSHKWYATATDAAGKKTRLANQSFKLPAELRILNETKPSQLVDSATVEVTFFGDDEVITRSTSNGIIDFSGLPLDQRFEATVSANGYHERTVVLPSLLEQRRVFMLNKSKSSVEVRFKIQDATGTFTQRSELFIEKPINVSGENKYRIITSRQFGVDGVTTNLQKDTRYNLKIRNQRGVIAETSTYSAAVSETVTLEPDAESITTEPAKNIGHSAKYNDENNEIEIQFTDPAAKTDNLEISVTSRDGNTTLLASKSYTDPSSISLSVPTNGDINQTYFVNFTGIRDGNQIDIQTPVGPQRDISPTGLPDDYRTVLTILAVLLVGGLFSVLNAGVGVLITALFGGLLWFFGFMSGVASAGSVALAVGVGALNVYVRR